MAGEYFGELNEAAYFFNRLGCRTNGKIPRRPGRGALEKLGITEGAYTAVMRIMVVSGLLDYDDGGYVMSAESREDYRQLLGAITENQSRHCAQLFDKAVNPSQFFFDGISDLEYEIYSRCDFPVTFETGTRLAGQVNLAGKTVLEPGGNSGGLGAALLEAHPSCRYTVVDTKIPCAVGRELNAAGGQNLAFIEGDVFDLRLPHGKYDYIVLMNLLHDFDDTKCEAILRGCAKYCARHTKFLMIEDILAGDFEPKEVVMHGLRLAAECRGGRQRTVAELGDLFLKIGCAPEKAVRLNSTHTLLVMGFD